MFLHEVIIAGFGGQGILSAGRRCLCRNAWQGSSLFVLWPMRGGTANCMVVVSDEPIVSVLTAAPH